MYLRIISLNTYNFFKHELDIYMLLIHALPFVNPIEDNICTQSIILSCVISDLQSFFLFIDVDSSLLVDILLKEIEIYLLPLFIIQGIGVWLILEDIIK